jgi:aspartate dehydrogenase
MKRKHKLRAAFIGWGAINSRVWALLKERGADVEIAGIATLDTPEARALIPEGVPFLCRVEDLSRCKPDLVVEAAGRAAIEMWAETALKTCGRFISTSTSAYCDDSFTARMTTLAERIGGQIIIPPGAVGAIDAIRAAAVLPLEDVIHIIAKPPAAWKGTRAETLLALDSLKSATSFFKGMAREAATAYPQNANATATTALAGIGLDRTRVELIADPALTRNLHKITAKGAFGEMTIALSNVPLATNPKSSELTALSLVRLIENEIRPFVM